jgi:FMN phosphatase YigB (HAD superfamily)
MLKAILFDLGDTLFDFDKVDQYAVFERSAHTTYAHLQSLGQKLPPFKTYFRKHIRAVQFGYVWSRLFNREVNCGHLLARLYRRLKIQLDEPTVQHMSWMWYEPMTCHCQVSDDVIPTLTRFRDRGLKLAIVSNTFIPGRILDRHLALHGLLDFFPHRIYSSEVGCRKPNPKIFRIALGEVGVNAKEAIFVGDSIKNDIVGAKRAGIPAILRARTAESRTHHIADHAVRTISELYQILPLLGAPTDGELPDFEELAYEA